MQQAHPFQQVCKPFCEEPDGRYFSPCTHIQSLLHILFLLAWFPIPERGESHSLLQTQTQNPPGHLQGRPLPSLSGYTAATYRPGLSSLACCPQAPGGLEDKDANLILTFTCPS